MEAPPPLEFVAEAVDRWARPVVRGHLGDVRVERVDEDGVVHFSFSGACERCTYRKMTLLGPLLAAVIEIQGVTGVACDGVPISQAEINRFLRVFERETAPHAR